jgi:hypothetical protein
MREQEIQQLDQHYDNYLKLAGYPVECVIDQALTYCEIEAYTIDDVSAFLDAYHYDADFNVNDWSNT